MDSLTTLQAMTLFEDSRFLILNKPAGLAVHGMRDGNLGLIERLRELRPNAPYLELAHRLDRDTSGCLVIAKRKSALRAFQKQQEQRGVDKHYLALVQGIWKSDHRKVDAPLLKTTAKDGQWSVTINEKGKRAVSYFSPVQTFAQASLMRIKIITGRTHQIRVHAASLGCPIAGDDKYGDAAFNKSLETLGLKRIFLHAESIEFSLPEIETYHIQATLPPALSGLIEHLKPA